MILLILTIIGLAAYLALVYGVMQILIAREEIKEAENTLKKLAEKEDINLKERAYEMIDDMVVWMYDDPKLAPSKMDIDDLRLDMQQAGWDIEREDN